MMMKRSTRLIAWLLTLVMVFNLSPVTVLADVISNSPDTPKTIGASDISITYAANGKGYFSDGQQSMTAKADQQAPDLSLYDNNNIMTGWSTDQNYTDGSDAPLFKVGEKLDISKLGVTATELSATLYPVVKQKIKVTYRLEQEVPSALQGQYPKETTEIRGTTITLDEEPSYAGYTFGGWTYNNNIVTGTMELPTDKDQIEFRGVFTENRATIQFRVDPAEAGQVDRQSNDNFKVISDKNVPTQNRAYLHAGDMAAKYSFLYWTIVVEGKEYSLENVNNTWDVEDKFVPQPGDDPNAPWNQDKTEKLWTSRTYIAHYQETTVVDTMEIMDQPLYNLAKIGSDWYRLRKTTIKAEKSISEYVTGLANGNQKTVAESEYTVADYDYTNEVITVKGVEYSYAADAATADRYTNYYTVKYENDSAKVVAVKNKIGGMDGNNPRWAIANYSYDDPNTTDSFHRNFVISLHNAEVRKYEVKFVNWNGSQLQSEKLVAGVTPEYKKANPTKAQDPEHTYEFIGWKVGDTDQIIGLDEAIPTVTGDVVYTAQFKASTRMYTITWTDYDNSIIDTTPVAYGDMPAHADPTRENDEKYSYTFSGWSPAVVAVTKDAKYKANYTRQELMLEQDLYNMLKTEGPGSDGNFYRLDVSKIRAKHVELASAGSSLAEGTYELYGNRYANGQYDFNGVTLKVKDVEYQYSATELEGEHEAYYTVRFDRVARLNRINDKLDWFNNEDGWVENAKSTYADPTNNYIVAYHADYIATLHPSTIQHYTVTWMNGDEVLKTDENVATGTEPTYDGVVPEKEATSQFSYEFAGWDPTVVPVTENATYHAIFTSIVNKYKVTFVDENGETVLKDAVEYEYGTPAANIAKPDEPTKTGYRFAGWSGLPETVTGDVIVKATYKVNQYTITFDTDGGTEIDAITQDYGSRITPPKNPEKTGYTFASWDHTIPETMPVGGDQLEALWTPRDDTPYTVKYYIERFGGGYTLNEKLTVNGKGTTGTEVTAEQKTINGYTYDENNENNQLTGIIAGDGSLELSLYYSKDPEPLYTAITYNDPVTKKDVWYGIEYQPAVDIIDSRLVAFSTDLKEEQYNIQPYDFSKLNLTIDGVTYVFRPDGPKDGDQAWYTVSLQHIRKVNHTDATNGLLGDAVNTWVSVNGIIGEYYTNKKKEAGWDLPGLDGLPYRRGFYHRDYTVTLNIRKYTVTWANGDKILETDKEVPYGKTPEYNGNKPTKAATAQYTYEFAGWSPEIDIVTKDITYYAQFTETIRDYTVIWKNGTQVLEKDEHVPYGTMPSFDGAEPVKAETNTTVYRFSGWSPEVSTVTGNVTYTAQFTELRKVTLTADSNEDLVYNGSEQSVEGYSASIEGVTFEGITAIANGMDVDTYDVVFAEGTIGRIDTTGKYIVSAVVPGTMIINPKAVTITVEDANKVYGEEDPTFTGTPEGLVNEDDLGEITYSRTNNAEDVGTYEDVLTANYTANDNYTVTVVTGDFGITKATMTVTAVNYNAAYDGQAHNGGATASVTEGTTIQYSLDGETWTDEIPSITTVGSVTYQVKATNANYEDATATGTLTVSAKAVTITVADAEKVYGEEDPTFTGTPEGLVNADDLGEITYSRTNDAEDVGTYEDVLTANYTANDNYTVTVVTGDFGITKATMTVTAVNYNAAYDGQAHNGGATASVTEGTTIQYSLDGETWTSAVPGITNVGSVTYQVKATNANYEDATATGTLTVSAKAVTITVADAEKVYGEEDPTFTGTPEGLVNEDDLGEITYSRTNDDENVGTYEEVLTANYTANDNYTVTVVTGDFEITKATMPLTVTGHDGTYDGNTHSVTVDVPEGSLIEYSIDGGETWTTDAPSITDAGSVAVQIRVTNDNYNDVTAETELVLAKAQLTVTTGSASKIYDATALTNAEASIAGLVNDETATATATGTITNVGSTRNTYSIAWGTAKAENYEITTENLGTLAVTPRTVTVTAVDKTRVYGEKDPELTWTTEGLAGTDAIIVSMSREAGENAGAYAITATVNAAQYPNYTITTVPGTFTIERKLITVTADGQQKVYGDEEPAFTAKVNGLVDGDSEELITYTVTRTPGEDVGTYTITASGEEIQGNYLVRFETDTMEILSPDTVLVRIAGNSTTATYDGTEKAASGYRILSISNELMAESDIAFRPTTTLAEPMVTGTNVLRDGETVISQPMGLTAENFVNTNPNFDKVSFVIVEDGSLRINPRSVTLTSAGDTKTYDGEALTKNAQTDVTVSGDGFAPGEGAVYTITGRRTEAGSTPNEFDYTLNAGTLEGNYNITKNYGTLTVNAVTGGNGGNGENGGEPDNGGNGGNGGNGDTTTGGTTGGANTNTGNAGGNGQTYTLTINYVDGAGNTVGSAFSRTYANGQTFNVRTPDRAGYTPDLETVTGTIEGQDVTRTVVYTPVTYTLTIRIGSIDGGDLGEPIVLQLRAGEAYNVPLTAPDGYNLLAAAAEGTMPAANRSITIFAVPAGQSAGGRTLITIEDFGTPLGIADSILGSGEVIE